MVRTCRGARTFLVPVLLIASLATIIGSVWLLLPRWLDYRERREFESKLQVIGTGDARQVFRPIKPEIEFQVAFGTNQNIRCTPFFTKRACYCVVDKVVQLTPEIAEKLATGIQPSANTYVHLSNLVYVLPLPSNNYSIRTDAGLEAADTARMARAEHPNRYGYARDFLEALARTQVTTPHELIFERRSPHYASIWQEFPQRLEESD